MGIGVAPAGAGWYTVVSAMRCQSSSTDVADGGAAAGLVLVALVAAGPAPATGTASIRMAALASARRRSIGRHLSSGVQSYSRVSKWTGPGDYSRLGESFDPGAQIQVTGVAALQAGDRGQSVGHTELPVG